MAMMEGYLSGHSCRHRAMTMLCCKISPVSVRSKRGPNRAGDQCHGREVRERERRGRGESIPRHGCMAAVPFERGSAAEDPKVLAAGGQRQAGQSTWR